jgi:sigma-54 dependent transcriptional regulator, acetoin dehydrogenase operon transcriptional activator AcoR
MQRGSHRTGAGPPFAALGAGRVIGNAEGTDTMLAWERFLTGEPGAAEPAGNFVVSSWQRSLQFGVDPTGRAAPFAARGDDLHTLRRRHRDLIAAASGIFAEVADLLAGSRSIMLLTDANGVVLEAVGDIHTLELGQDIHLTRGGDWREDVVGTNGIGTTLATGRPAQVHAAEHFCEGIKSWTCAGAPIFEPGSREILGVVDISGPPFTYQRNNLTLAVTAARQIETALAEHAVKERMRLLEVCLHEISSSDAAGLIVLDRFGRLVHATGRIPSNIGVGERVPGLNRDVPIEDWASRLPEGWRPEWLNAISLDGRTIGALLVIPGKARSMIGRAPLPGVPRGSENDPARSSFDHIIGRGGATVAVIRHARQLVGRAVPLLIQGETGVGKELLARAIHDDADDRRPFIAFNCGAVSKELVAAELFGHVPGAFTGATREGRPGRFELAHQGTLCLDEIGEMPLDVQPVLMRALEEGVVYRVGDTQPRRVAVRLIAITNRDLHAEVQAGRFRRDLYYRISVTSITVPPLRDRAEDIETLVDHFNRVLATRHQVPTRQFAPGVMAALQSHAWPGNVRELRNLIERLLLTSSNEVVTLDDMPPELTSAAPPAMGADEPNTSPVSLDQAERGALLRAIHHENGNLAGAARRLGVSRSTIYRKIGRYGLEVAGAPKKT